jgi:hypothetical protein
MNWYVLGRKGYGHMMELRRQTLKMHVWYQYSMHDLPAYEVQNKNDLVILEGNDINDERAPSDGVDYEMVDSDDESYDPANPDTYEDYF